LRFFFRNSIFVLSATFIISTVLIIADSYTKDDTKNTEVCLSCHEDEGLYSEKDGKKISLYVNPDHHNQSVHAGAECVDCHAGYNAEELPHTKVRQEVNCNSCHDDLKGIEKSVHKKVECYDCHTKHEVKPVKEIQKDQTKSCLSCHKNKNIQLFRSSIHAKNNIGCNGCHKGGHETIKIQKNEVSNVCGKCHNENKMAFKNSVHSTVFKGGNANAPVCTDCHGAHQILTSKISIESEGCLNCHLNQKLFPGEARGSASFVAKYKTSIHASLEKGQVEAAGCVDCHGDHMIQNPEDPKFSTKVARQIETCGKCHKDITDKFKKSKHGQELMKGNGKAPTCSDCHGEHDIKSTLLSDEFSKLSLSEKCLSCHKDGKIPHKNFKGEEELITGYQKSVHYNALKNGDQNAPTCSDCHGAHEMEKADNPDSRISKKNIANTCGQSNCHDDQLEDYTGSIHQIGVSGNNKDAPTCNNCHGNHGIISKDVDNKLEKSNDLIKLCSNCHASVELIERNELPTKVSETYKESFHGLATRGGSKEAANCESCHGNHNVRPSKDSLSTISKANLPNTCGKCHPGATEILFTSKIHIADEKADSPWVYLITRFYLFLIFGLISLMLIHNVLDYRKKRLIKNNNT